MIPIDKLKDLYIYRRQSLLPITNKPKYGSLIWLLSPNVETSSNLINNKYFINRKYFESYYLEKDVNKYIKENSNLIINNDIEYSMEDSNIVFNRTIEEVYLIDNANKENYIDNDDISINTFKDIIDNDEFEYINKYINMNKINNQYEFPDIDLFFTGYIKDVIELYENSKDVIIDIYSRMGLNKLFINVMKDDTTDGKVDYDKENKIMVINSPNVNKLYLLLINNGYITENIATINRVLYKNRIKTNAELKSLYKSIKEINKIIKFVFYDISRYQKKNLYVDLYYYIELFYKSISIYPIIKQNQMFMEFFHKLFKINDYKKYGYEKFTIFIPIDEWYEPKTKMWYFRDSINPISIIYQLFDNNKISNEFKDINLIFISNNHGYFIYRDYLENKTYKDNKQKNSRFRILIKSITSNSITKDLIDIDESDLDTYLNQIDGTDNENVSNSKEPTLDTVEMDTIEDEKEDVSIDSNKLLLKNNELINNEEDDDNIDENEDEEIDEVSELYNVEEDIVIDSFVDNSVVEITSSRRERMNKNTESFLNTKIDNKIIKDIIEINDNRTIVKSNINISTANKQTWSSLSGINIDKNYDIDADIMKVLLHFTKTSKPISILDVSKVDNSDPENKLWLYTVKMEDFNGKRFTIKFDIPKIIDDKYFILKSFKKQIQMQLVNPPISKTNLDTAQIVTNYSKTIISRYGASNKSIGPAYKFIKLFNNKDYGFKVVIGDASKINEKYNMPLDYLDISSNIISIESKKYIVYFDQNQAHLELKNKNKTISYTPVVYHKPTGEFIPILMDTILSYKIIELLSEDNPELMNDYLLQKDSTKYVYSRCKMLNTFIPLVIICAYAEGLTSVLKKAKVEYKLNNKKYLERNWDHIRYKDGYLSYKVDYNSSLLMNGLKECNTIDYSIMSIDDKKTYIEFMDLFGGRIKTDGLENFQDCFIDPITESIMIKLNMPHDYVGAFLYANKLLADTKFQRHNNVNGKRIRRKELIAVKLYKALFIDGYNQWSLAVSRRKDATFTLKQSAVIDRFFTDPTFSDASIVNALNDVESNNEITSKGESGLNENRAYGLDKRTFDESMINSIAMSTGFAGTVGLTRNATINIDVDEYGFIRDESVDDKLNKSNSVNTLCITEAINPMVTTRDDSMRTAMAFIQTQKHNIKTVNSDPLLVTNGADEALPILSSSIFVIKAKMSGFIKEYVEDDYAIISYSDNTSEFVDLKERVEKNSGGGTYTYMKFIMNNKLKLGSKVKEGDIIAYDRDSFSQKMGVGNLAYNAGSLTKVAIINTHEGFEDSQMITQKTANELGTIVVSDKSIRLQGDSIIDTIVSVGDFIEEGEPLLVFMNAFDDELTTSLIKKLNSDEDEVNEWGKIIIKSPVSGTITDIRMYRVMDIENMSDSLARIFTKYENDVNKRRKIMKKNNASLDNDTRAAEKLPPTGKMKGMVDSVLIEFYVSHLAIMSGGDKLVFDRANKGTVQKIVPDELAPYTDFRPNEKIGAFINCASVNNRKIRSIEAIGSLNKLVVELDRACKDLAGIKYDDSKI